MWSLLLPIAAPHALHTMTSAPAERLRAPSPASNSGLPKARYFTTLRDHFSGEEATWQQAYYVNDTFYKGPGSPVFLCVGGEGPCVGGAGPSLPAVCPQCSRKLGKMKRRAARAHLALCCPFLLDAAE